MKLGVRLACGFVTAVLLPAPAVFAQVRAGAEFQVNVATTGDQLSPSLSVAGTGGFVVVWESLGGIFGRRYDAAGVPVANELRVDSSTTVPKATPTVASHRRGNFVVAWAHSNPNSIHGRRFDPAGQPSTGEMRLASGTFGTARSPRLDAAPSGWFSLASRNGTEGFDFVVFHPTTTSGEHACGAGASGGAGGGVAVVLRRTLSGSGIAANATGLEILLSFQRKEGGTAR